MLLGLLPIVCSILVTGMAERAVITDYPNDCPPLNNLQPANLTTAMMAGQWYETDNDKNTGYICASYTHVPTGDDTINSTFSADFKTDTGSYAPNTFPLLWELKNSTNPRANGAACMVTNGHIIQGPYWFCAVTKDYYIAYSCDANVTQTLHVVTRNPDANKEDYKEIILNCGIPESVYNQLEVSYSSEMCSQK